MVWFRSGDGYWSNNRDCVDVYYFYWMKIRIRKTDQLFSKYLREKRGRCERCGRKDTLQVSHFYGRRNESVRFDEVNCDILCFACHRYFTENPNEYRDWKFDRIGEKEFKKLKIAAFSYKKRDDKQDLLVIQKIYGLER